MLPQPDSHSSHNGSTFCSAGQAALYSAQRTVQGICTYSPSPLEHCVNLPSGPTGISSCYLCSTPCAAVLLVVCRSLSDLARSALHGIVFVHCQPTILCHRRTISGARSKVSSQGYQRQRLSASSYPPMVPSRKFLSVCHTLSFLILLSSARGGLRAESGPC